MNPLIKTIFYLCTLFCVTAQPLYAQQNLVPNPSFEDTVYCPYKLSQVNACSNWMNFGNSPDYFNACATNGMNVPYAFAGFQYAYDGNGQIGLITYANPNLGFTNYREFVGTNLLDSMLIGSKYYFTMYVNYSGYGNVQEVASNKIGVKFTTAPFDSASPPPINNFAHIYTDSIFTDTIYWHKISGSIVADSIYKYIVIGNFFDDSNTDTINVGALPRYAYYYVDFLCSSTDSLFCETTVNVINPNGIDKNLSFYPNPFNSNLYFDCNLKIIRFEFYDLNGKLLQITKPINNKIQINFYSNEIIICKTIFESGHTSAELLYHKSN